MLPTLPPNLDQAEWMERWDRMQARYLPHRQQRFELMVGLVQATQDQPTVVVDLGCGTGSLIATCLARFPSAELYGVDLASVSELHPPEEYRGFPKNGPPAGWSHGNQTDFRRSRRQSGRALGRVLALGAGIPGFLAGLLDKS
jgi:hypothetical protein